MRRAAAAFPFVLLLGAALAAAADPKAVLTAPAQALAGQAVTVQLVGTVSDRPVEVAQLVGPGKADISYVYTTGAAQNVPPFALVSLPRAGRYTFVLVAEGTPDGSKRTRKAYAMAVIEAVRPGPGPAPAPDPAPVPTPTPTPEPVPVPVPVPVPTPTPVPVPVPVPPVPTPAPVVPKAVKVYAVLVYDPDADDATSRALAAVVADPTVRDSLAQMNVEWRAWRSSAPEVAALNLAPYVAGTGGVPALVVYDVSKNVYDDAGRPIDRSQPRGFRPPTDAASLVAYFKNLRGPR